MPVRDFSKFWLCQLPYVSVRTQDPYGSCRTLETLEILVRGPHDTLTGIAQGLGGVLWIIGSNHKCTAVSSHTGHTPWCDHENSTSVKFVWVLHSALRARTHMGAKNHRGPWLDVTKASSVIVYYLQISWLWDILPYNFTAMWPPRHNVLCLLHTGKNSYRQQLQHDSHE